MGKNIVLYMHAGSGNHGCEAIVSSTCKMLGEEAAVISARTEEDRKYGLNSQGVLLQEKKITENFWIHLWYFMKKTITGNPMCYIAYRYQSILGKNHFQNAISIGGDNYCYPEQVEDLILLNRALNQSGSRTVLWGVSIEPELLKRADVISDMKRYSHIFAREAITYHALLEAGVLEEKVHFYPDPAFCLEPVEQPLPEGFQEGNTVGINISPMIIEKEVKPGITMKNYHILVEDILQQTDMQVALVPHVVWENNDDRKPLEELYESFRDTGRVIMIRDCGCRELKGYIKKMRFLIAARTHASIAAYSSQVPVLVAGYSVKAKGIAEDLFGTAENYVIPVQNLQEERELSSAFGWLREHEKEVRGRLKESIPHYIQWAEEGGKKLKEVLKE